MQKIKLSWKGEEYDAPTFGGIGDMIAFETHFGVPSSTLMDDETDLFEHMDWLGFMAWRSARKGGVIDKTMSFEEFVDDLDWVMAPDAVEAGEEGEQSEDPLQPPPLPPELSSGPVSTLASS